MSDTTTTQVENTITDFEGVETISSNETTPAEKGEGAGAAAPDTETFDEETYIKGLGFASVEEVKAAKTELETLRAKAQTPAEIKFANEQSQKFYEYVKEGKKPELRAFLFQEERLERMSAADVSKLDQAAEVIKLNMQLKNKDLTPDEIDFQFSEDFSIPEKPEQDEEESEEAFQKREDRWKKEVERVEKRMVIAAKQAKPELAKFQSELVLPDIQRVDTKAAEAAQKELEAAEAEKTQFLAKLSSDFKNFNGYSASYKDAEVEIAIGYGVPEEEKAATKSILESFVTEGYSSFFQTLWFDKDGNPKIDQMMSDIYLLKNKEKIFQKMVSETGEKRKELFLKGKSNIKLEENVPRGTFDPNDAKTRAEKELEYLMEA